MRSAQSTDVEAHKFANHRDGDIKFQRLLQGDPDAPNNFELSIVRLGEDYVTPRHRHNFSQLHLMLEGTHEWAPDRLIPTGAVTYFPEGTFYGPQQGHGGLVLGIQYGEASGSGFMSYDRLAEGNKRLAENPNGRFEDGIYHFVDADGKQHNQDGYEAIWQEIHGRPVVYPAPRYQTPITILPDAFAWVPSADEPGIAHKHLATFSERGTRVGFIQYDAGATHRVPAPRAPELHFVVEGALRGGDGVFGRWTAIQIDPGDEPVFEAIEATTVYVIGLPVFD